MQDNEDQDPVAMLSNLFVVTMGFAVTLIVALVFKFNMTEIFSQEDYTIVKNPGRENMESSPRKGRISPNTSLPKIRTVRERKAGKWAWPTSSRTARLSIYPNNKGLLFFLRLAGGLQIAPPAKRFVGIGFPQLHQTLAS